MCGSRIIRVGVVRLSCEADMLAPAGAAALSFCGRDAVAVFEQPVHSAGVPDVTFVVPVGSPFAERGGAGPLLTIDEVVVMSVLSEAAASGSVDWLSRATGIPRGRLSRSVLPGLAGRGHVVRVGTEWVTGYLRRSPAELVVTVEAKVSDVRAGIAQAARHRSGADLSWLLVGEGGSRAVMRQSELAQRLGVGVAVLTEDGPVVSVPPSARGALIPLRRELLAERSVAVVAGLLPAAGVPLVFGNRLVATGDDPRLGDVSVPLAR